MTQPYKKISTEVIHHNPWWKYCHDRYVLPGNGEGDYFYGEKVGGVIIIPVLDDGKLLLVRQYRYLQEKFSLEFPRGGIETDETPLVAAQREFLEETGQSASSYIHIGTFEPSCGLFKEPMHVFIASGIAPSVAESEDQTEAIETLSRRVDELEDIIKRGEIWDGETLAAWGLARFNFVH